MAFAFGGLMAYISASPFVLQDVLGLSTTAYTVVFAVNSLGMISVGLLSARLVGRLRPRTPMTIGQCAALGMSAVLLVVVALGAPAVVALPVLFQWGDGRAERELQRAHPGRRRARGPGHAPDGRRRAVAHDERRRADRQDARLTAITSWPIPDLPMTGIGTSPIPRGCEMTDTPRTTVGAPAGAGTRAPMSVLVLAVGTFAVGTGVFAVAGFLPAMAASLGVSEAAAGQSVTVFALAYAALAPVLATMTARMPRRALLVGGLCVLAVADLGSALAPGLPALTATRVLAAAGAAAFIPTAGAAGAELAGPEFRGRALAFVVGGLTAAAALGVPLGALIGHLANWRAVLAAVAGLCLAVAGGVRVSLPPLPGAGRVPLRERMGVLRRPGVLTVLPLTVLGMTAAYTAYAYSVPALAAMGVTGTAAVWMLAVYGVGAVLGILGSGHGTDRRGPVSVLGVVYPAMALAFALSHLLAAGGGAPAPAVAALVFLWGAASWAQTPPQQHRLIGAAPDEVPLVVSVNSSAIYVGIALGTALGGAALTASAAAMYGAGTVTALLAWIYLIVTTRRRRASGNMDM
ncbi:MFS transporter [Spongiactinospora sp. TRM90649]|uniref:MFS transporter n=1 Tax=Spongiactinospora sp. TRM90649 TaxID=3031114 RepID=UPI0023F9F953|nr:MFS transporter [Spongiactinospora sp. TRM90649]MDF5758342.1 MFS transporter [Spongiactinospora sp. TRM90649]